MGKKSKNYGNAPKAQGGANVAAPAPPALITRFLAAVQQAPLASQEVPDWSETEVLGFVEQLAPESRGKLQGFLERFASLGSELKDACGRQAEAQRSAEAAKAKHDEALAALETDRPVAELLSKCAQPSLRPRQLLWHHAPGPCLPKSAR